jgi:site-specific recombinase XerD
MDDRQADTIGAYAREYGLLHDVRENTLHQYRIAADLFERWAGGAVRLKDLDEKRVSEWLRELAASRAPSTVRAKRTHLLTLWRAAADESRCEPPIRRIRSIRVPFTPVEAWDADEARRILDACTTLNRRHRCGLPRGEWWSLAVRVAWDTSLRRGDQLRLPVSAVRDDGSMMLVQSKTGRSVMVQLNPDTLSLLRASLDKCPRDLVTPWPSSEETFSKQFRLIVHRARVRPGTWKWLRRSGVTDVEAQWPGEGSKQAGHAPGSRVTAVHYLDMSKCGQRRVFPRPL